MLIKNRLLFTKRIESYINLKIDTLSNLNVIKLKGPLGCIKFSCCSKFFKDINTFILLKKEKIKVFIKNFREALRGIFVPWIRSFAITGYQYKIAYSFKQHQLGLGLGFTYWILIDLTTNNIIYLKTIKGKLIRSISRKFLLTSIDYTEFKLLQNFLNTVRNLLPYKLKGLTFPEKKIKLKIGKKIKYR